MQALALVESVMPAGTLRGRFAPFRLGNRGVLQFAQASVRDEFVAWHFALPEHQKLHWNGQPLSIVRQKPIAVRRRSARCFEAQRLLSQILPQGTELEAVPGRLVVVANGATVAMLHHSNDEMIYNWNLLEEMVGGPAVASLRQTLG